MSWHDSCIDWLKVAIRECQTGSFRIAIIAAHAAASEGCESYLREKGEYRAPKFHFPEGLDILHSQSIIDDELHRELLDLHNARNKAAHHPYAAAHHASSFSPQREVTWIIYQVELLLDRIRVPWEQHTKPALESICYSRSHPEETIKLSPFCSKQFGFSSLCPTSWVICETPEFIKFSFPAIKWSDEERILQLPDSKEKKNLQSRTLTALKPDMKILAFRRASNLQELRKAISRDLPFAWPTAPIADAHVTLKGAGFDKIALDFHLGWPSWHGLVIPCADLQTKDFLIVSWHQYGDSIDIWRPLLLEILSRLDIFKPQPRPASFLHSLMNFYKHQLFARDPKINLKLASANDPIVFCDHEERMHVDFLITKADGRQIAGIVEWPSTVLPNQADRWRRLNAFADEVHVFIPEPFASEARQYRANLGHDTIIFGYSAHMNLSGRMAINKLAL